MNQKKIKAARILLALIIILSATLACYYRLVIRSPDGNLCYMMRWDANTYVYPRLIFNSDCIRDGFWPLWNPYMFGGCPWFSDLSSYLYHPTNLLIILLTGYTYELFQLQYILIYFLGGFFMYLCLQGLSVSLTGSLIGAISFLSCGFFVGGATITMGVKTMVMYPLLFLYFNKITIKPRFVYVCIGAIVLAVTIMVGYPTMVVNFLLFLILFTCIKLFIIQQNLKFKLKSGILIYMILIFIIAGFISAVVLVPALVNYPLINRAEGLNMDYVSRNSLNPFFFLSSVFPFLGPALGPGHRLNLIYRNCGIGLVGILFAVYYFIFTTTRFKWLILSLFLLALIFAFGMNTPIYSLLFRHLYIFRITSYPEFDYRAIFLFFLCMAGGLGAGHFLSSPKSERTKVLVSSLIVVVIGFLLFFYSWLHFKFDIKNLLAQNYFWLINFSMFIVLVAIKLPKKILYGGLIALCIFDTSCWTKSNFETVAVATDGSKWSKKKIKEKARLKEVDIVKTYKRKNQFPSRQRSTKAMFWKYFSDGGHNSTRLKSFQQIMSSSARGILSEDFRIMPIYDIKILESEEDVIFEINKDIDLHRIALVSKEEINDDNLLVRLISLSPSESNKGGYKGEIKYFSPNQIKYDIFLEKPALIFFNEIYYPGWLLKEGDKEIPLFRINTAFRGAYLKEGRHYLVMLFSPLSFKIGLVTSSISILFCLTIITLSWVEKRKNKLPKKIINY
jgi:hypothetical protein